MSESEQRRSAPLARLLRPFRREPSDRELAAVAVREHPELVVGAILKQVLEDDETMSTADARTQMRIQIDGLQHFLDGETRSELARIADRQIDDHFAALPPADTTDAHEESREPATP